MSDQISSFSVIRDVVTDSILFRLIRYDDDPETKKTRRFIGRIIWEEFESGSTIGESFKLPREQWHQLLHELKDAGLLPGVLNQPEVIQALKAHLADMQGIAKELLSDLRTSARKPTLDDRMKKFAGKNP